MSGEKAAPKLSDYFDNEEQLRIRFQISEENAMAKHDDYEEVYSKHKFTEEQAEDIMNHTDMAERGYEIARTGGFTPMSMEDILSGKDQPDEPEPGSAKDVYG